MEKLAGGGSNRFFNYIVPTTLYVIDTLPFVVALLIVVFKTNQNFGVNGFYLTVGSCVVILYSFGVGFFLNFYLGYCCKFIGFEMLKIVVQCDNENFKN